MSSYRAPYGWAALAAASALALYVVTLAPTTAFWDTSEYIATAHILGLPHPPGNPLFVAVGRVWSLLLAPLGFSVAVRINLLAAVTSATATGFFFLVAHRVLAGVFEDRHRALVGAGAAALLGATAFTVWNQSNVNEKVYTLSVLVIAAVTWLALRWRDRHGEPGAARYLLAAVFLLALGSTNHLMSVLPAPALALLVLLTDPRAAFRPAFLGRAALLVVVGLSFNFFLPIRAAQEPVINEGDPVCESFTGAAAAVYTNGAAGCPALADNLTRRQYQKPPVTQRMAPFKDQLLNYWQYFDWQWSRGVDPSVQPGTARTPFTLLFALLGLVGLGVAWRSDRVAFAYLLTLAATLTVGLVYYLNFKYGFSLAPEVQDPRLHEVRERDYFFIAGFLLWGNLAGVGLAGVWRWTASLVRGGRRWVLTAPILALAVMPLALNWHWASRAGDWAARDWAFDLLMSVEPYAILFTNGDNDTFPLWYLQEVEGIRRDVTVVVGQYLFTSWYPRQLRDLTAPGRQRPYDPSAAPDLYPVPEAPPAGSISNLSDTQMAQVGRATLEQDVTVSLGRVGVQFPAGMTLDRSHQLALSFIRDSSGQRPIYFAAGAALLGQLGLEPWGVRHGLAVKLELRSLEAEPRDGLVKGQPEYAGLWFDLERSLELYREIYLYRSIRSRAIWADRSTLSIPWQYYALALQLSDVARQAGVDMEIIERLQNDAVAFQTVAQGGPLGTPGQ